MVTIEVKDGGDDLPPPDPVTEPVEDGEEEVVVDDHKEWT